MCNTSSTRCNTSSWGATFLQGAKLLLGAISRRDVFVQRDGSFPAWKSCGHLSFGFTKDGKGIQTQQCYKRPHFNCDGTQHIFGGGPQWFVSNIGCACMVCVSICSNERCANKKWSSQSPGTSRKSQLFKWSQMRTIHATFFSRDFA